MDTFELEWGDRYPGIVKVWRSAWEQFTPFLRFPPEIRKVVYTTNLVESINYQLRKITKTRGHFGFLGGVSANRPERGCSATATVGSPTGPDRA